MTRVTKARVRQVILVDDEPIDPYYTPEKMQFLRPDGTIVDPTKDNTKLSWRGEWDPALDYNVNDVVTHDGKLWVSSGGPISAGHEPGFVPSGSLATVSNQKAGDAGFGGHNQTAYVAELGREITDAELPLTNTGGTNITQGIGSSFVKIPAGVGVEVTIEWAGGNISVYDGQHGDALFASPDAALAPPGWSNDMSPALSPMTFTVPPGDASQGGGAGVSSVAVELNASVTSFTWVDPTAGAEWEDMSLTPDTSRVLPPGGSTDDRLAKASGADFDVEWVPASEVFPGGGATGAVLAKVSGADGDVAWATPHYVPAGGASGKLLAKASGSDYDLGWVSPPTSLPAGGATGTILTKNSGADGDAGWAAAAGGGTDREKYLGEWNAATAYSQHDVVKYRGGIWIATGAVSAGTVPTKYDRTDVQSFLIRGCRVWSSDRIASTSDVTRTISALDDVTDISSRKAKIIWVDKNASVAGPNVTFTNDHPTAQLNLQTYDAANNLQVISGTAAAAGGTATLTMPTNANDMFIVAYFTGSDAGSFRVKVSATTSLVAPPTPVNWQQIGSTVAISDTIIAFPSSGLTSGNESTITVTFDADLPNLDYIVAGHLEDGAYSHQCGWRVGVRTKDTFQVTFKNNYSANTAMPILRARLIY